MYLSKTKIERTAFRPFQLFGPVILPDAWAVKGVGMITTKIRGLPVSFFSTHLMAGIPRFNETRSFLTPEWKGEMFEVIAHMIEQTDSDAFVLGGDFNIHFGDEEYECWKRFTSLEGTLLEEKDGTRTWCKDNNYAKTWPRQIDYLFVSPRLKFENAWVDFKEKVKIDGKDKSLSDHYALSADITAVQGDSHRDPASARNAFRDGLHEVRQELEAYYDLRFKEEQEQMQTQDLKERVCLSCRIKKTLEWVMDYQKAIDSSSFDGLTDQQQFIKIRLDSWFEIFR